MKKPNKIRLLCAFFLAATLPGSAFATSLLEVYQQALQSDPQIHEAEARRLAALEAEPQARGVLLPQIGFDADWTKQESSGNSIFNDESGVPASVHTKYESETTRWQFGLRQTLFRWDQIVGLRRADKLVARAEAVREAAQQDLIVRVTERYFNVLAAEDQLLAIHANRAAIARQLEQAKQRFEVGLIAITDVQESQAAYDRAGADEIAAKRLLATARGYLREITGEYVDQLAAPTEELPLTTPAPADENQWVDYALDQNLSLVASRIDEQLANDEISFRRSGHYPTVELVASSGSSDIDADRSLASGPFLSADQDGKSDSIGVVLNIPIFAGGYTSSRVRESVYLHRASLENLQRVTRETERQTRDAYLGVLSEISRVQALARAVESSQTALEATQAGFDVGTRTIVDVLNFQFQLYQSITNYQQSRYDYVLNYMRLKQAAGTLQVQDLEILEPYLENREPPEDQFAEEAKSAP
ncbi:MAG TPA: TolC family outer membrane protein [Woeseiaceae bacterium]|nr:TolC family outer membrane protein [Woeseiaceae bacterium]